MSRKFEKVIKMAATLLLAVAPIVAFDIGSFFVWGEPKLPNNLRRKD